MKQITIYDLLPLLNKGYVFFDGSWSFSDIKPEYCEGCQQWEGVYSIDISLLFNIAPFDGDWKDSLIKVEHKEEE